MQRNKSMLKKASLDDSDIKPLLRRKGFSSDEKIEGSLKKFGEILYNDSKKVGFIRGSFCVTNMP